MTIKQTWAKSIEGGYRPLPQVKNYITKKYGPNMLDLLNPGFWQSLGKALEWKRKFAMSSYGTTGELGIEHDGYEYDGVSGNDHSRDEIITEWQYRWHSLIDHLADGGTIESYFDSITIGHEENI